MKKNIAIVSGGYSGEIDVSFKSASTILSNIDKEKYNLYIVSITKEKWAVKLPSKDIDINKANFSFTLDNEEIIFDFAFIAIHGTPGEDGKLQGYFDMINLPYSTGNVWNTSLTFNKISTKQALDELGFYTAKYLHFTKGEHYNIQEIISHLGFPIFVKPAESGSSLGISKVKKKEQLEKAIQIAFKYHNQVLLEEFIGGREITCGVWTNKGVVEALPITEVITQKDFFDYSAKYEHDQTIEITPAELNKKDYDACQQMTKEIYFKLNCKGIARIDYILSEKGLMVIEVNTVPGLTEKSFIPQQAKAAGYSLEDFFGLSVEQMLNE